MEGRASDPSGARRRPSLRGRPSLRYIRRRSARAAAWIGLASVLVLSAALAITSHLFLHGRFDLTRDREFTLGRATLRVLEGLPGRVTARVMMSRDLPAGFRQHRQRTLDLLREFEARANGRFVVLVDDPGGDSLKRVTALALGVEEVQLQERDHDGMLARKGFFGLVLVHGERKEVFPVIRNLETLEYDLVVRLMRLTGTRRTIGVVEGRPGDQFTFAAPGRPPREGFAANFATLFAGMQQLYDVVPVRLDQEPVPGNVSLLFVAAPRRLTEPEVFRIDQFVMSGRPALFLAPGMDVDLVEAVRAVPADNGYDQLLAHYGLEVSPDLVLEPRRWETVRLDEAPDPEPYPYWIVTGRDGLDAGNPVTASLPDLVFPWVSSLRPDSAAQPATRLAVLARSTDEAWTIAGAQDVFPRPLETYRPEHPGHRPVAALRTGTFASRFADGAPEGVTAEEARGLRRQADGDARVFVVANALFATDFFSGYAEAPGNVPFLLNALDYLALDPDLIHARSRFAPDRALDEARASAFRIPVLAANIALVPLLLVLAWIFASARRRAHERMGEGKT